MTRGRLRVAVAVAALGALAAGVVLWLGHAAGVRAAELLIQAEGVVSAAEEVGLRAVAEQDFAAAEAEIQRGRTLLDDGARRRAVAVAEAALELARAARARAEQDNVQTRTAELVALSNRVLYRPQDVVDWRDAVEGSDLFDGDRIATEARSEAILRFEQGNEMRVEEDSVVIVKSFTENRAAARLDMQLEVPEGRIRSMVSDEGGRDVHLELRLPNAEVVVDTSAGDEGRAELRTEVIGDSTRIAVYEGQASVTTGSGEETTIGRDQFAEVSADGQLSELRELPSLATALAPDEAGVVYLSPYQPAVTLRWQHGDACPTTRVEMSRDERFLDKLVDEQTPRSRVQAMAVDGGAYRWRLSCIGESGVQGPFTEHRGFSVVHDGRAPALEVLSPTAKSVVGEPRVEARCRSESSALVFINGSEASGDGDGEFTRVVELRPGLNRIVFEAVDPAGNASHVRQFVTRAER